VMSYEEIDKYSKKYGLKWKDIYQLDAEFSSFVKLFVEDI